ncbi:hypothetical protein OROGR_031932 [Orobanche gracilis]
MEPSGRSMRYTLASVILRLLGSRVVYEDACHFVNNSLVYSKRDFESVMETSNSVAFLYGGSLFDCLLLVLHALLSSIQPSWLKMKSEFKSTEFGKDYAACDREVAESLQNDLDIMELPDTIRWRIQTAMPLLPRSVRCSISCQPPSVSPTDIACLHPINPITSLNSSHSNPPPKNPVRASASIKTKPQILEQEFCSEIDQWAVLEDGAGSVPPFPGSTNVSGSDHVNMKASNLLKGAVRIRRTDLTYITAVDEDR